MLRVQTLKRRSRAFERLVGLTPDQFDTLLAELEPGWDRARRRSLLRADRVRAIGGGRTHKLELPGRLLVTLLYLRPSFTVHVLEMFFDLDDSNVCRNIHALLPVLEQVLPAPVRARTLAARSDEPPKKGEQKPRRIRSPDGFVEAFPEDEDLIVDATEQPRGQPRDRKKFFSVKAGTHTIKTQVAVTPDGLIRHLSAPVPGRMHDMRLLRRSRLEGRVPCHVRLWGARGYTGLDRLYPDRETVVPHKKPKGGVLSNEDRETNRLIAKVRITVENVICHIRKFRACGGFFRNPLERHGVIWGCVAGLVNLRTFDRLALDPA